MRNLTQFCFLAPGVAGMTAMGQARRFVRLSVTSGYPPKLTVSQKMHAAGVRAEENHRSPGRKRTGEWQAIAGTLVPNFGLRTAASELDASLWLAAHEDYKLRVLTGLRAQRLVGDDQGRSWRCYSRDAI